MSRTSSPLEQLLSRLREGDESAAASIFVAYEPYLRLVVRRQLSTALRARFDSADVVQSVWADLLLHFRKQGWRFSDVKHLQAFLVQATRNRFVDRLRQHGDSLKREQSLQDSDAEFIPAGPDRDPGEMAQMSELWEQVENQCSPAQANIVRLRRQGYTIKEIAGRTGYHPSSVRRVFYDLALRMSKQAAEPCK